MNNLKLVTLFVFVLMFGLSACKSSEMATDGAMPAPTSDEMPLADEVPEVQSTSTSSSFDVDALINKHIAARGGADNIKATETVKMTGKVEAQGMNIDMTIFMKRPYKMRAQLTIKAMNAEINQGYDGEIAWMQNPGSDPQELPKAMADRFKDQADIDGALLDYKEKGGTIEYLGEDTVNDSPAHKVKLMREGQPDNVIYLDASTYLEVKSEVAMTNPQSGQTSNMHTMYSDYRSIDGLQMPHKIEVTVDGTTAQKMIIEMIELNVEAQEQLFEMPGMNVDIQ